MQLNQNFNPEYTLPAISKSSKSINGKWDLPNYRRKKFRKPSKALVQIENTIQKISQKISKIKDFKSSHSRKGHFACPGFGFSFRSSEVLPESNRYLIGDDLDFRTCKHDFRKTSVVVRFVLGLVVFGAVLVGVAIYTELNVNSFFFCLQHN